MIFIREIGDPSFNSNSLSVPVYYRIELVTSEFSEHDIIKMGGFWSHCYHDTYYISTHLHVLYTH